jgi:hypothetical protein
MEKQKRVYPIYGVHMTHWFSNSTWDTKAGLYKDQDIFQLEENFQWIIMFFVMSVSHWKSE